MTYNVLSGTLSLHTTTTVLVVMAQLQLPHYRQHSSSCPVVIWSFLNADFLQAFCPHYTQ